jgi:phospholipid/cholesterol/gamma-HCH transport system substrate-binding protein
MRQRHPTLKFGLFALVCLLFTGWLVVTIGKISFQARATYSAEFDDVLGLLVNDDVKISGVTVGQVRAIEHIPGGRARVTFAVDETFDIPEDSRIEIRWWNLLGLRMMYVVPGSGPAAPRDHEFPRDQTSSPADLGSLLLRLTPFIDALQPELQNQVLQALSTALVGREADVQDLIRHGAELTTTIAGRDQEITSLLQNSATILDAYAAREQQLRGLLDSFAEVATTLRERNDELDAAIISLADGQAELRRLVEANEDEIRLTLDALEAVTAVLSADHARLSRLLETAPDGILAYHLTSRVGQWFNVRPPGISGGGDVLSTERGAYYPRSPGHVDTGPSVNVLLGGGLD